MIRAILATLTAAAVVWALFDGLPPDAMGGVIGGAFTVAFFWVMK